MLAHFIGDLHQSQHVAAVYRDTNGRLVDPDAAYRIDPTTDTEGGNPIRDQHSVFHAEWDAIPADLGEAATPALLSAAKSQTPSQGNVDDWPAAWASDTVLAAHFGPFDPSFRLLQSESFGGAIAAHTCAKCLPTSLPTPATDALVPSLRGRSYLRFCCWWLVTTLQAQSS